MLWMMVSVVLLSVPPQEPPPCSEECRAIATASLEWATQALSDEERQRAFVATDEEFAYRSGTGERADVKLADLGISSLMFGLSDQAAAIHWNACMDTRSTQAPGACAEAAGLTSVALGDIKRLSEGLAEVHVKVTTIDESRLEESVWSYGRVYRLRVGNTANGWKVVEKVWTLHFH